MKERYELALEAVKKAGKYLQRCFEKVKSGNVSSRWKGPLDLVSEADEISEHIIVSLIHRHFPHDGILSEESKEEKRGDQFRWIIDSLEGSHNFLTGCLREWGCSVALEDLEKETVVFGICFFPEWNEFFTAQKDKSSFCNGEKIRVSVVKEFRGQMFFCDSALRFAPEKILQDIKLFNEAGCRLRVYGSFQFAMTRLALGQGAIVINRTGKPWDNAAVSLIVEEAGGLVTDEEGKSWQVNSTNILASNRLLHQKALRIFS